MRSDTLRHADRQRVITRAAVLAMLLATAAPAYADIVRVEAAAQADSGRVALIWPASVGFTAESADGRLYLRFDRPVEGDFWNIRRLRRLVDLPKTTDDGRTLVFTLKRGVTALAYNVDNTVVLEFARLNAPQGAGSAPPAADATATSPPAISESVPKINVRTGQHPGYSRVVFDWKAPVGYTVEQAAGTATVIFEQPAEIDPRPLQRKYLKYLRGGTSQRDGDRTRVTLHLAEGSIVRDLREGNKIVVDVLAPVAPGNTGKQAPSDTAAVTTPPPPSLPSNPVPASPPPQTPQPPPAPAAAEPATDLQPPAAARSKRPLQHAILRFDWDRPTAAAIFRRGDIVWCVFDVASVRDTTALAAQASDAVRRIDQRPHDRATVLRIEALPDLNLQVARDGLAWVVRFVTAPPAAGAAIVPEVHVSAEGGASLLLPVAEPGEPLAVGDPVARETMIVVPVIPLGSRIAISRTYPQFRLPETMQGIVVQPSIDTLRVRALRDGVAIDSLDGLAISSTGEEALTADRPKAGGGERLVDGRDWKGATGTAFVSQRQALERAVTDAPAGERAQKRLRLAQFLITNRFALEALGVLQVGAQEQPPLAAEPAFRLLRGAARLLAGRLPEAKDDLGAAATSGTAEAKLWLAAARTASGEPLAETDDLGRWTAIVQSYPPQLRAPVAALLAEAAIDAGKLAEAQRLIEIAKPAAASNEMRAQLTYLDGRRRQAAGDVDGALASFEETSRLDPRRGRAQAELARTQILLKEKRISPADAIATLDALRFGWRGDDVEFRILRELGRMQLQAGDYPAGLRTLKQAVGDFPTLPGAQDATREMAQTFETLYLGGGADRLSPVTALALYDEFKELTPPGEKGRLLIRRLADRLAGMDLLERAAALLEGLLPSAEAAAERAGVGARLAEIRLLDGKPEAALDALRRTSAAGDVAADLQQKRTLLQARALATLGRGDEALTVLGRDDSLDAALLRAKIYRSKGDWGRTATAMRRVVEITRSTDAGALDERQARDILDLAVALTLAGSDPQLTQLDDEYQRAMAATPLKDAFRLLAGSVPPPDADAAALAELVEKAMAFRRSLPSGEGGTAR